MFNLRSSTEDGFTIVELLVTIGICGIMIPVLALGLTNLTLLNNRARDLSLANMLAQNKAELLRSSGYNSITVGTTDFSSELPSVLSSPKSASYIVSSPQTGIKKVDITISYKDVKTTRSVNYSTLISEIGINQ